MITMFTIIMILSWILLSIIAFVLIAIVNRINNENTGKSDLLWCFIVPFLVIPVALIVIFIETNCFNIPSFVDKLIDKLFGYK